MRTKTILVVDDDESLRRVTELQLEEAGYEVVTAASGEQALRILEDQSFPLVITDFKMPGLSGMDLLKAVRKSFPQTSVLMITAFGTVHSAVEAMKAGAYDYITKPIDYEELVLVVNRAMEHQQLVEEVQHLRTNLDKKYGFESIIGHSKALLMVLEMASRVAPRDSTVLIRGETGTGKELLAHAIHQNSARKSAPFVTINCGAIPRDLLESELFGHVRGSFTGAFTPKRGKVETADGGTLFLDEIGELPLELQVKLLRLIQYGEIEKLGATASETVDVRIIAATHRNLQTLIEDGSFREDLFYRLAVIPLELPPLRERPDDIPELVEHLFLKAKQKHNLDHLKLPAHLIPYFCGYRWPGNIRELENIIERLTVLSRADEITVNELPEFLRREKPGYEAAMFELPPHGISLEGVEKELILRALKKFDWNQTKAAAFLDISRRTLIYRMEKYGFHRGPAEATQETVAQPSGTVHSPASQP
jgi:two-component system NtrC family response regulator